MNAREILKTWPGLDKANAATLLASEAWRLETEYAGKPALVRPRASLDPAATLDLDIALDGEPHRLRIADSESFADLHRLWSRRRELPGALVLALVERECGPLLQTLENAARRRLSVAGLSDGTRAAANERVVGLTADGVRLDFAIDLSPVLTVEWGRLDNIDVTHPSVRALVRPARAEFARYDMTEAEVASLAPGGALLLPEDATPTWLLPTAADDLVHVLAVGESPVTFAQVADDDWPPLPDATGAEVCVERRGAVVARGTVSTLGLQRAVRIA